MFCVDVDSLMMASVCVSGLAGKLKPGNLLDAEDDNDNDTDPVPLLYSL